MLVEREDEASGCVVVGVMGGGCVVVGGSVVVVGGCVVVVGVVVVGVVVVGGGTGAVDGGQERYGNFVQALSTFKLIDTPKEDKTGRK